MRYLRIVAIAILGCLIVSIMVLGMVSMFIMDPIATSISAVIVACVAIVLQTYAQN
jgi:hypothetical protein